MRIDVDRTRCEGHGRCAEVAPTLMRLGEDDYADAYSAPLPDEAALARRAVGACPVAALTAVG